MSEMIERVAKAIEAAEEMFGQQYEEDQDGLGPAPAHSIYQTLARAAIEAMREPNETMEASGAGLEYATSDGDDDFNTEVGMYLAVKVYTAMIEAALKEDKRPNQ